MIIRFPSFSCSYHFPFCTFCPACPLQLYFRFSNLFYLLDSNTNVSDISMPAFAVSLMQFKLAPSTQQVAPAWSQTLFLLGQELAHLYGHAHNCGKITSLSQKKNARPAASSFYKKSRISSCS